MNKSDNIEHLALALSNLQGELEDAHKSKAGHGYNYADLSSVLNLLRPALKRHGLSIAQPVSGDSGSVTLTTMLLHSSGQFIDSSISIAIDVSNKRMNSLQAAGSTITYLRRYVLMSLIGLAATDDDGDSGGEYIDRSRQAKTIVPLSLPSISEADRNALIIKLIAHSLEDGPAQGIINKALTHYQVDEIEKMTSVQLQTVARRIEE